MALTIAIGKYDEYPESQDKELEEIYMRNLDVSKDIEHLSFELYNVSKI